MEKENIFGGDDNKQNGEGGKYLEKGSFVFVEEKKTEKEKEENRERRALNSAWKYTTLQSGLFLMALCCVGSKKKYFCKHASQVKSWYVCCVWHQVWYTKNVDLTSGT